MALGASIGIGLSGMANLAAPGQKSDRDPAKTIAVYLMAAPESTHQPILDGLSLNAPDFQFVVVRSKRDRSGYAGFIVAEGGTEQFYYELDTPEKNRYRVFDDESIDRLGINALTAIAREEGANMRLLAEQIKTGIAQLPAFSRADQK